MNRPKYPKPSKDLSFEEFMCAESKYFKDIEKYCDELEKELDTLKDKEKPKKPIKDYSINKQFTKIKFSYVCPSCNKPLGVYYDELPNDYDKRCGCCGQVIDWSEKK